MIIKVRRGSVTTTAVKTQSCIACGTRLRQERPFWLPCLGRPDEALAELRTIVRIWLERPEQCRRCPERIVSTS